MDKCKKITGEDYEKAETTPLLNVMREELRDFYGSLRDPMGMDKLHYMHKKNTKAFKKLWGEQSCCWNGEYRFWIWFHELPHTNLYILSSNRGTSYEFARADHNSSWDKSIKETREFLNILLDELQELGIHHE